MTTHVLKTVSRHFDAIRDGRKPFDVRRNDRAFQTGDIVRLVRNDAYGECADPDCSRCRPDSIACSITFVYAGDAGLRDTGGMVPGWVVLGLKQAEPGAAPDPWAEP